MVVCSVLGATVYNIDKIRSNDFVGSFGGMKAIKPVASLLVSILVRQIVRLTKDSWTMDPWSQRIHWHRKYGRVCQPQQAGLDTEMGCCECRA